jgi:hypothetical protein
MNMDKIRRRPLVWCLLAILFPLAANAAPVIELRGAQMVDIDNPPDTISIAFLPDNPLVVHIDGLTEETGDVLDKSWIGEKVRLEAVQTDKGLLALAVAPGGGGVSELQGFITGFTDTTITLFGHEIPVPDDAYFEDINGTPIPLGDIRGLVSVGGRIVDDYFEVAYVKETAEFVCLGGAIHMRVTIASESDLESESEVDIREVTEDYCFNNGKRTGTTRFTTIDWVNPELSSYTQGKLNKEKKHGFWVTVDVIGRVVAKCKYDKGKLKGGDKKLCPK